MRIHNAKKLFSYQDLRDFTECSFAVDFDLCDLTEPIERKKNSEWVQILFEKGTEFESDYLASLSRGAVPGKQITEIPGDGSLEERLRLTHDAMSAGADLIYQAALYFGNWHGYADILRKIDGKSKYGDHSYEVIDIKSRLEPSPENLLQVSLYTFLLGEIQQALPKRMYIVTGDLNEHSFKYSDFSHYFGTVLRAFEAYVDQAMPDRNAIPLPCSFCQYCKWRDHCDLLWDDSDHVSKVGGVARRQVIVLQHEGIENVSQLAGLDEGSAISGIGESTLSRIRINAALQLKKRKTGC